MDWDSDRLEQRVIQNSSNSENSREHFLRLLCSFDGDIVVSQNTLSVPSYLAQAFSEYTTLTDAKKLRYQTTKINQAIATNKNKSLREDYDIIDDVLGQGYLMEAVGRVSKLDTSMNTPEEIESWAHIGRVVLNMLGRPQLRAWLEEKNLKEDYMNLGRTIHEALAHADYQYNASVFQSLSDSLEEITDASCSSIETHYES